MRHIDAPHRATVPDHGKRRDASAGYRDVATRPSFRSSASPWRVLSLVTRSLPLRYKCGGCRGG